MEALSETENDDIAIIYASDAESWALFLQKKLCSDDYMIQSSFHAPNHDDIPELFSSFKPCAVLVSPFLLDQDHSGFWNRCVDLFHQRTVILSLGVSKEDMRGILGEDITQKVLEQRWLEVDSSPEAVKSALIALIEAYEAGSYDYLPPPRERNGILRTFPDVLYEYGSLDVLVLLEREEEDTVTMTTEIGCSSPIPIKVERVTFSAYIATIPSKLVGEVKLEVFAGKRSLGFVSVHVESRMEQLHSLLLLETSPLTLMCKAMGVSGAGYSDVEQFDLLLAQRLAVSQFPSGLLDLMLSDDQATADRDNRRWPTLLHLAAEFNLTRVCEELLGYPGMIQAACTENSEGLLPSQLAGKKRFHALQRRLISYVESMRLRRSATDSGISFAENVPPPRPHHRHRSSGRYENDPGPMSEEDYIDMSGCRLHEVGITEAEGSKETDESRRQRTAELLRQTVSECVSRTNTSSKQHWPDPGRPDTSDDQDHHVPARVGYLATHKQQDPDSSGKTRSWSESTSRSPTDIEVGIAEAEGSKETDESRRQRTAELLRQTVSECVSRTNTSSKQHWPDPGRPDTSDDQDHHVPARVGYLATHKQQDPDSSGKTRSWSESTTRPSTTLSLESRPESAESEEEWHWNEAPLRTKGPMNSMAKKNMISSFLRKMNIQRLPHSLSESDLDIRAKARKKPVVYRRQNITSTRNPSLFYDFSSSQSLNVPVRNKTERDSVTLCGYYNTSRRRVSVRITRALQEDLSQRPELPPRRK